MSGDRKKTCARCGAELQEQQDWCLQCGKGSAARGSTGPGWRSALAAVSASAVLALGAAAAAYAALKEGPKVEPSAVATTPPPATPSVPETGASTGATGSEGAQQPPPSAAETGGGSPTAPALPKTPTKPPKIPGAAKTPQGGQAPAGWPFGGGEEAGEGGNHKGYGQGGGSENESGGKGKQRGSGNKGKQSGSGNEGKQGEGGSKEGGGAEGNQGEGGESGIPAKKAPILLDTNAASVYNPLKLSPSLFGDPSLAIDGDVATAWRASIEPGRSPKVSAGLIINLRSAHNLAKVALMSSSTNMVVVIYGTKQRKAPRALSSSGWVKLSGREAIHKRKTAIELRHSRQSFRQVLVWIVESGAGETSSSSTSTSTSTSTSSTSAVASSTVVASSTAVAGSATSALSPGTGVSDSASASTAVSAASSSTSGEAPAGGASEVSLAEIELYERAQNR